MKVRFPCTHDKWFRHPTSYGPGKWNWCDGGRTVNLTEVPRDYVADDRDRLYLTTDHGKVNSTLW